MKTRTLLALILTIGGLVAGYFICDGNGFFAGGYFFGYLASSVSILLQWGAHDS